ncbi:hypothetical protein NPIL_280411 [Nephila pilipes]|uniref:Uncharacterized protein n=1 Tax=Nephila pilipes TaxID=299642 RepID=A0A8X6MRC4_NEPPI|nr:hypothetical protein NPIL_280411 [Nephila pilipes]
MILDVLGYRKVSARCVPRNLIPDCRSATMEISFDHSMHYAGRGNQFLFRIIIGDETLVHHFTTETSSEETPSMTEKHPSSPVRKQSKLSPSGKKRLWSQCSGRERYDSH